MGHRARSRAQVNHAPHSCGGSRSAGSGADRRVGLRATRGNLDPEMARLLLFASAREAAGVGRDDIPGATVGEVLDAAAQRYGDRFRAVLPHCRIWCNGDPADPATPVADGDEVAVLPPVSGGAVALDGCAGHRVR